MNYNESSQKEIEHIDYHGHLTKIQIPNHLMQKIICNCDKEYNTKSGDPCNNCKHKYY